MNQSNLARLDEIYVAVASFHCSSDFQVILIFAWPSSMHLVSCWCSSFLRHHGEMPLCVAEVAFVKNWECSIYIIIYIYLMPRDPTYIYPLNYPNVGRETIHWQSWIHINIHIGMNTFAWLIGALSCFHTKDIFFCDSWGGHSVRLPSLYGFFEQIGYAESWQ